MAMQVTESLDKFVRIRWATPLVVAVAVAFLAVNEIGYQSAAAGIRSGEEIYNRRVEVRRLQLLLQAAEAGQRGYLLTGQPEYREPFEQAQAQLEPQLSRIRAFFADDAASQGNVR
jgi:CHASE3 domain sensor protein